MANIAWILASNLKRVMVLDWDLEAPGLHRYFHPFLPDKELTATDGLIDFIVDFANDAVTGSERRLADWYIPRANLLRYAASLKQEFPAPVGVKAKPGTIDFIPAGRQGPDYATRVNSFNWQQFYERLGGGVFLETAKRSLSDYDYVLIDSRTGVSDTSGICTIQMPDILVVLFTMNTQSIEGVATAAESAVAQRKKPDGSPGLRVFPVPCRIELAEKKKLDLARETVYERFDQLLWHVPEASRPQYWGRVEVPYEPFYAYEEVLATLADRPHNTKSVLAAMEVITEYVTESAVTKLVSLPDQLRLELLAKFDRKPRPPQTVPRQESLRYWFYLSYARADRDAYLDQFLQDLGTELRLLTGEDETLIFFDTSDLRTGEGWSPAISQALATSRILVSICSPSYFNSVFAGKEVSIFIQRMRQFSGAQPAIPIHAIIPIQWSPVLKRIPEAFRQIQMVSADLPEVYGKEGLRYLMRLRRYQDEYRECLVQLARVLAHAAENPLPALEHLPLLNEVVSAFVSSSDAARSARVGPRFADLIFAVGTREEMETRKQRVNSYGTHAGDWRPFAGYGDIAALAQQSAIAANVIQEELPIDSGLFTALEQSRGDHRIVIAIVDPWMPGLDGRLRGLDERPLWNLGIIVVWNLDDPDTREAEQKLKDRLNSIFALRSATEVRSYKEFQEAFANLVQSVQMRIIQLAMEERAVTSPRPPKIEGPFRS